MKIMNKTLHSKSSIRSKIAERSKKGYEEVEKRMVLATQIADAIKNAGLTKKQFADKIGKQPSEITKWLSGTHNFTTKTITKIEQYLNVKLDYNKVKAGTYKLKDNKYSHLAEIEVSKKTKQLQHLSFTYEKCKTPKFIAWSSNCNVNAACLI